jgi:hypothetical protein
LLGSGPSEIAVNSTFDWDPVIQFIAVCQVDDFDLVPSNVFEVQLLSHESPVSGKSFGKKSPNSSNTKASG